MRRRPPLWLGVLGALAALEPGAAARAQDELGVTAEVERPLASTGGEDPTASATTVDATDRPRADEELADALLEVPGARPLRSGAFGSPTTLSLRGSDADQVEVLFGALPISSVDGNAFDLSVIPLWALERVEVYRGGAPTWLGVSGMGGVLRLVPRTRRRGVAATAGAGSFGLVQGRASGGYEQGEVDGVVSAGVTHAAGDFPYTFDVTRLEEGDEVRRRRENAALTQASALSSLRWSRGRAVLEGFAFGTYRAGGVPGPASQPTRRARREEGQAIAGVGLTHAAPGWRLAASVGAAFRARAVDDPDAEVGLVPRAARDDALRTVARLGVRGDALEWLELIGVGLWIHEALWPSDPLARTQAPGSNRDTGRLALEARLHGRIGRARYELRPSARLGLVGSRLHDLEAEGAGDAVDRFDAVPTFRLAGALEPTPGVTVSLAASSATRTPTPVELFGDRAFLRGNAALAPERAERFEGSLALRGQEGDARGQAELRGFVTLASDLIRYQRSSAFLFTPENVDAATLAGAELGLRGELTRHFALSGAASWLETWTTHLGRERALPYRPRLTAYLRPELRAFDLGPLDRLALWADVVHVASTFEDPANTNTLAARTRFGVGASVALWDARLRLDVSVRDVLDAGGTDLLGFPLPGRWFSASLSVAAR